VKIKKNMESIPNDSVASKDPYSNGENNNKMEDHAYYAGAIENSLQNNVESSA